MHIEVSGDGPDLVLLHGWGMNALVWEEAAAALAQRFRVHNVDLPGHGQSPACTPFDLYALTAALAAELPPRATICGWSLGGQLAINWARTRPRQVERLVLIATTPRFVQAKDWDCGIDHAVLDDFAENLTRDWRETLHRFNALQARGDAHERTVSRRLRKRLLARGEPVPAALSAGLNILRQTDLRAELTHISQPTLILHGARDGVVPVAAGEYLQRTLPCATLDVFDGTSHALPVAQPQRAALRIGEFCGGA